MSAVSLNFINSGRILFGDLKDGVYDILAFLDPGLMVDCGAAVGGITSKLRERSPASRVISFEPFPGNHVHFEQRHRRDSKVTLYKAAVGAERGRMSFFTPSTVRSAARKKATPGASFVGRLVKDRIPNESKTIEVDVFALDDICKEQVRFLKIDIQGGEEGAIQGASNLISNGQIDIIYIELMRQPNLLKKMAAANFVMFDTEYLVTPKSGADLSGWRTTAETVLSTGRKSIRAWPDHAPAQVAAYNQWVVTETEKVGSFTTDLVAVRPAFIPEFLIACGKANNAATT